MDNKTAILLVLGDKITFLDFGVFFFKTVDLKINKSIFP